MKLGFGMLKNMNWFGVVLGTLMLALPFLGPWWVASAGDGAARLAMSPFDLEVNIAGQVTHTTLIEFYLLAAKISFLLGGTFLLLASIFTRGWWSKQLARFGVMKPFWAVIKLLVMVIIGTLILTIVVPMLVSSFAGGIPGGGSENSQIMMNIPYFTGVGNVQIAMGPATVSTQVNLVLTGAFYVAVVTAALSIIARIYHRKFMPRLLEPKTQPSKPLPPAEKPKPSSTTAEKK